MLLIDKGTIKRRIIYEEKMGKKLLKHNIGIGNGCNNIGVREVLGKSDGRREIQMRVWFIWITWHMIPQQDIFIS